MTSGNVLLSWPTPQVSLITLNDPDRLNALTVPMVERLLQTLRDISEYPHCRVVIITGAGRGFCAGLNLQALDGEAPLTEKSVRANVDGQEIFSTLPAMIRSIRLPVIAAVNGPAAGAGMAIALAADIRVAAQSASFHIAAVKIGLSAGECGISYHLPRLIGASRALEHMLTGRPILGSDAERVGLVSRLVPTDKTLEAALEIAAEIIANSPFAVEQTKKVARRNLDNSFETAIDLENLVQVLAVDTEDSREAIDAFRERRPPNFLGR